MPGWFSPVSSPSQFSPVSLKNVYPVTMLLISTGFFIVTLVEILVSRCRKNKEVLTERLKASSMHHQPEAQCQT